MDFDHLIVEINDKAAGVLARIGGDYQFFASDPAASVLNRQVFSSVQDALAAIAQAVAPRH